LLQRVLPIILFIFVSAKLLNVPSQWGRSAVHHGNACSGSVALTSLTVGINGAWTERTSGSCSAVELCGWRLKYCELWCRGDWFLFTSSDGVTCSGSNNTCCTDSNNTCCTNNNNMCCTDTLDSITVTPFGSYIRTNTAFWERRIDRVVAYMSHELYQKAVTRTGMNVV
jgi:hypothetical protein